MKSILLPDDAYNTEWYQGTILYYFQKSSLLRVGISLRFFFLFLSFQGDHITINSCRLLLSIITHVTISGIVLNKNKNIQNLQISFYIIFIFVWFEICKYLFELKKDQMSIFSLDFRKISFFVEHYIVNLWGVITFVW